MAFAPRSELRRQRRAKMQKGDAPYDRITSIIEVIGEVERLGRDAPVSIKAVEAKIRRKMKEKKLAPTVVLEGGRWEGEFDREAEERDAREPRRKELRLISRQKREADEAAQHQ